MNATMDDVFKTAQYLLKYGGRLAMVHRADRTADLITIGRKYHMEPKRMRFVYARKGHTAVRVLIEWRYGDGSYTEEVCEIYGRKSHE